VNDLFEHQLRADLHTAAGRPAYDSIDPTEVIGEGRRVVRRRHRLQAFGAAAAVAVLGVGGFLATDTGRTTTAPPAHHSSTAPVSRAVLSLGDDGYGRFILERSPDGDDVRILDTSDAKHVLMARLAIPANGRPLAYTVLSARDTLVGLLPRGSHLLQVSTDAVGENTGYVSDVQSLGGDLVVFGARFDEPGRLESLSRILWADPTDMVWDTNTPLPSVRFESPGDAAVPQLVWLDAANEIWGTSDPVGGALSEKPLEAWAVNSMGGFEPAGSKNAGRGTFVITGLLPYADVSKLTATWAPGVTVVSPLQGQQLTSGDRMNLTAFHAVVTTHGELPEPLLRSVDFTGPGGQQRNHSYTAGNKR
jgi:hypothetical protein